MSMAHAVFKYGSSVVVGLVALVVLARPAAAEDTWSKTVAFSRSDASAIKVVEPEGYRVTVTAPDGVLSDTAPAVFKLPPGDAFYLVTLTAPGGAQWSNKIEVKKYQTTELRVKHVAAGPAPAPGPAPAAARTYIGSVRNKVATCGKKLAARVEFINAAGAVVKNLEIKVGAMDQASLPGGTYDVRAYVWDAGANDWTYQTTQKAQIDADNWSATLACGKGALEIQLGK